MRVIEMRKAWLMVLVGAAIYIPLATYFGWFNTTLKERIMDLCSVVYWLGVFSLLCSRRIKIDS